MLSDTTGVYCSERRCRISVPFSLRRHIDAHRIRPRPTRLSSLRQFSPHRFLVESHPSELPQNHRDMLLRQVLWPMSRHGDFQATTRELAVAGGLPGELHEPMPAKPPPQPPPSNPPR